MTKEEMSGECEVGENVYVECEEGDLPATIRKVNRKTYIVDIILNNMGEISWDNYVPKELVKRKEQK